jgi:hypothetical protein
VRSRPAVTVRKRGTVRKRPSQPSRRQYRVDRVMRAILLSPVRSHLALSDVDLAPLLPRCAFGPAFLRRGGNLLSAARHPHRVSHSVSQLLVSAAGTYTAAHTDFMGCDGWLQLVSGVKLWLYGLPQHRAAFLRRFAHRISTSSISAADRRHFRVMGVRAFLQRAGDLVVMPGGVPHAVHNLTPTVAFGGSHLRPYALPHVIDYLQDDVSAADKRSVVRLFEIRPVLCLLKERTPAGDIERHKLITDLRRLLAVHARAIPRRPPMGGKMYFV